MKPLAFLFDRNFPRPIARMMEQYVGDETLARFQDDDNRFEITTPDVDIIRTLSEDDSYRWVLVSLDKKITKRPAEKATLATAAIKFFYCGKAWHKMKMHDQAGKFLRSWPQLVEIAENHRGKVFEIEGANLKITHVG
jgi:PIN like domain